MEAGIEHERLTTDAADRAARYLDGVRDRRVSPAPSAVDALGRLSQPLQEQPLDPAAVLAELDAIGSAATVATAGGRYFGFVIGGSLPAVAGGRLLAAAWDQNAGLEAASPAGWLWSGCAGAG